MRKLLQKIIFCSKKAFDIFNNKKFLYFSLNNTFLNLNINKSKIKCFLKQRKRQKNKKTCINT